MRFDGVLRTLLSCCVFCAVACGSGVSAFTKDSVIFPTLFGTIVGDVDLSLLDGPVRVGIVWAGLPELQRFCLIQPTHPVAQVGCVDYRRFSANVVDASTAIDLRQTRNFAIELTSLPSQFAMVRTAEGYIAYGSVMVYVDRNNNQTLDLIDPFLHPLMDIACTRDPSDACTQRDVILAASFVSLDQPQVRLVYREGGFTANSLYYPTVPCLAPQPGFSLLATSNALDVQANCEQHDLSAPMLVWLQPAEELRSLACISRVQRVTYPYRAPMCGVRAACLDDNTWVFADPSAVCPSLIQYDLRGCWRDPVCANADWDMRDNPPSWWPCGPTGEILCEPTDTDTPNAMP